LGAVYARFNLNKYQERVRMHIELKDIITKIVRLRDARYQMQYYNPKDVALSMVLEASDLMEHFQWKTKEEIEQYVDGHKEEIGEALADVLYWVLLMSHDMNIDVIEALDKRLDMNEGNYPIETSK
jgi:dCTP diphosphatase